MFILDFNILNGLKLQILTPKREEEHPCYFYMGVSLPPSLPPGKDDICRLFLYRTGGIVAGIGEEVGGPETGGPGNQGVGGAEGGRGPPLCLFSL